MTHTTGRCSYNTRLAGWMSVLVATATFAYLQDEYMRLPLIVPVSFAAGSPDQFAFKSPGLVFLPFGLQIALGLIFGAVVAIVLGRKESEGSRSSVAHARHTAEGVALLAMVWIAFQAVNAWRLIGLWRHMFDANIELYVLALITAITASITIGARVMMQVNALGPDATLAETRQSAALRGRSRFATAGLAAVLAVGIGAPLYLLSVVWSVLRPI
jgi:hypothetical protein